MTWRATGRAKGGKQAAWVWQQHPDGVEAWHLAARAGMCGQQQGEPADSRPRGSLPAIRQHFGCWQGKKLKKFIIFGSCSANTHWRAMIKPCICSSPSPSRKRRGWLSRRSRGDPGLAKGLGPRGDRDGAAGTEVAEDTGPCLMAESWQPGARPRCGMWVLGLWGWVPDPV